MLSKSSPSSLAAAPADVSSNDLQSSAFNFAREMLELGVDIRSLVRDKKKELHYSEFGLGGGTLDDGSLTAATVLQVRKAATKQ